MPHHRPPGDSVQTFGTAELKRVPSPAARMMAAKRVLLMTRLAQNSPGPAYSGNETRSSP
jgi:hypothetical protein